MYVYRIDGVPTQGTARVRVGGLCDARLANGEYTRIELPSGPHVVKLQFRGLPWAWGWDEIPIQLKDGDVLYLRLAGEVHRINSRPDGFETRAPRGERYGPTLLPEFATADNALVELRGCRLTMDVEQ